MTNVARHRKVAATQEDWGHAQAYLNRERFSMMMN